MQISLKFIVNKDFLSGLENQTECHSACVKQECCHSLWLHSRQTGLPDHAVTQSICRTEKPVHV